VSAEHREANEKHERSLPEPQEREAERWDVAHGDPDRDDRGAEEDRRECCGGVGG
jgi:hypothetical protein